VNYDTVLRSLERMTMAPTPWWDRPMRSAWETDDPGNGHRTGHDDELVAAGPRATD
jgi:hypothetical protein